MKCGAAKPYVVATAQMPLWAEQSAASKLSGFSRPTCHKEFSKKFLLHSIKYDVLIKQVFYAYLFPLFFTKK
jgi:hypothetical protein